MNEKAKQSNNVWGLQTPIPWFAAKHGLYLVKGLRESKLLNGNK